MPNANAPPPSTDLPGHVHPANAPESRPQLDDTPPEGFPLLQAEYAAWTPDLQGHVAPSLSPVEHAPTALMDVLFPDSKAAHVDPSLALDAVDLDLALDAVDLDLALDAVDLDLALAAVDLDLALDAVDLDLALDAVDLDLALDAVDLDLALDAVDLDLALDAVDLDLAATNPLA